MQLFNRATEPLLPKVRPHTFAVLEDLDERELTNHVPVITRHKLKPSDIEPGEFVPFVPEGVRSWY